MDRSIKLRFGATLLSASSILLASSTSLAEDLMSTYQLAIKNDANWAAKKAHYLAEREGVEQAFGTMLPIVDLNARYAQQEYDGATLDIEGLKTDDCIDGLGAEEPTVGACIDLINEFSNLGTKQTTESYTTESYGLSINQPLFRMDRWYGYKVQKSLESRAQSDLAFQQQELIVRVSEAYFGVLRAEEELRLAKSEEASLETQLTEIKNRYKLGLARDTDLFEVQAGYDITKAARLNAEGLVDNVKEDLRLLTRQSTVLVNPLPTNIPIEPPKPLEVADWEEYAKQNNYQVIAAQFAVDASATQVKQKRSGHAPTVDLFFDYRKSETGGGFTPSSTTQTIGVNLRMPIFEGGITSSQEKQARHQADEAKQNKEFAQRNAVRETRQYHRRVMTDVYTVNAHERAVRSNNSAYRSIKIGYESGLRSLTDLLSAQKKVFSARKELVTARYDYILDTLKLKRASGILSPNDLEVLNSWLDEPTTNTLTRSNETEALSLEEIDGIKLKKESGPVAFEEKEKKKRSSHKSLYDAFKAWRKDE